MQQENMETNNEVQERSDEFLNEVNGTLNNVAENLRGLISDLNTPPTGVGIAPELARLQNETQSLRDNLEFLIGPFLNGARKGLLNLSWYDVAMTEGITELEALKTKYASLQREWDSQQEHLGKLQGEVFKLRNQLQHQTSFCASLGSIMGNLVWKASRVPNVIDTLLAGDKLSEFCSIVTGTLVSFMETYNREFPDQKTDEMQFILSLAGTVANIAASPDGRHFLASDQNGKELLDQIINILPHIPPVSGDALKRILLMALYNLSINQNGLLMLQDQHPLLVTIQRNIKNDRTPELKLMSLRLLQSVTYEITSLKVLQNMLQQIPLETIREFTNTNDAEIRLVAQDVVSNLEKAITNLTDKPPNPEKISYEDCYMVQNYSQQQLTQQQGHQPSLQQQQMQQIQQETPKSNTTAPQNATNVNAY
ncbi:heat shock factor 2-binding protein-like [Lycorma delicatula]|uniref:heat shock factor 2-binding protein-like n=1 Tax=Lycorma delicatula TaxID=130591 RepID=UPI003F5192AB